MKRGFTLVEVAVALLLVGVVAYIILALSRTLEAGAATGLEEEVLHAAETVLETGLDAPCGSSPPLVLTLAGKSYRVCQQTAGLSITPSQHLRLRLHLHLRGGLQQPEPDLFPYPGDLGRLPSPPPPAPTSPPHAKRPPPTSCR